MHTEYQVESIGVKCYSIDIVWKMVLESWNDKDINIVRKVHQDIH